MREIQISEREYNILTQRLEFFDTMRNNLLTFSFTSVLTVLGIAIAMDMDTVSAWICLIPFFLIIPFTARISYYRLASAHINSFLRKFKQVDMQFAIGTSMVTEDQCKHFKLIAWLVNHEMVLLGVATSCTFYFKYIFAIEKWIFWNYVGLIVPILFIVVVYIIADSTYNYKKLIDGFSIEWDDYADNE